MSQQKFKNQRLLVTALLMSTTLAFTVIGCGDGTQAASGDQTNADVGGEADLGTAQPDTAVGSTDTQPDLEPGGDTGFETDIGGPDADASADVSPDLPDLPSLPDLPDLDIPDVAQPTPNPLAILFIGNSFTSYGPVPPLVHALAVDAGWPEPQVDFEAVGGYHLSDHRARSATVAAVDRGDWDVVILQEYSTGPTNAGVGDPVAFREDATWFYDRIQAASPGARVILYETWARHPDHSAYPGTWDDPAEMQAELRFHYRDCAENHIPENAVFIPAELEPPVEVAPVGDAWEEHLSQPNALRLHATDDYHPGTNGIYLNALVIYATIYGRATAGLPGPGLSAENAERLQRAADAITGYTTIGGPDGTFRSIEVGETVQIDFGSDSTAASGWNNFGEASGSALNLANSDGDLTGVDLEITDAFNGSNELGLPDNSLGYPASASQDTLWVGSFGGHSDALAVPGQLTLSGLPLGSSFDVTIYAARTGTDGGIGRLTRYRLNSESQDLEVSDNRSNQVIFEQVESNAAGQLVLDVEVSPDGSGRFGYIGVLTLSRVD